LNCGHIKVFEMAKAQGDYLIVGLNTNELVKSYKKREPILPWDEKRQIIEAIKYVDLVVPAPEFSPLQLLKGLDISVYCVAEEWKQTKKEEISYMNRKEIFNYWGKRVVYIPDFGLTRTSQMKEKLLAERLAVR